jgi:hypothetical protein
MDALDAVGVQRLDGLIGVLQLLPFELL